MENILEVKNVEKYYGTKSNLTKAIDNISFNVEKGEFVGIMGASGSGKTTLLNCISTIDRVTTGHIIINGDDITKLRGNKLNKFILYPLTPMAIIDLLSILPSITLLNSSFKLLKIFRLFRSLRLLKILKLVRYSKSITMICNVFKKL